MTSHKGAEGANTQQEVAGVGGAPACCVFLHPALLCTMPLPNAHTHPSQQVHTHTDTDTCRREHLQRHTMTQTSKQTNAWTHLQTHAGPGTQTHKDTDTLVQTRSYKDTPIQIHRCKHWSIYMQRHTDTSSHPCTHSLSDTVSEHPSALTHLQIHAGPGTQYTKTRHVSIDSS